MPSFSSSSVVRVASEHFSLSIQARHCLLIGSPSHTYDISARFPGGIDVLLSSDLVLTLSGVVDRVKVSSKGILVSAVAGHLVRYLETNASQIGLSLVSDIYVDEDDGLPKLTLTSSRPLSDRPRLPHATLVSIDLQYIWRTATYKPGEIVHEITFIDDSHPFSPRLLLPVESILNNAVEKFASLHLIKSVISSGFSSRSKIVQTLPIDIWSLVQSKVRRVELNV